MRAKMLTLDIYTIDMCLNEQGIGSVHVIDSKLICKCVSYLCEMFDFLLDNKKFKGLCQIEFSFATTP
jgi:hypothetical protein